MKDFITNRELKYMKIINWKEFIKFSINQQKKYLIENKIFVKGPVKNGYTILDDETDFFYLVDYGFDYKKSKENMDKNPNVDFFLDSCNLVHYNLNKDIADEFFTVLKSHIEFNCDIIISSIVDLIEFRSKKILYKEDKLTYLKNQITFYTDLYTSNIKNKLFENKAYLNCNNWNDFVEDEFGEDLFKYLSCEYSNHMDIFSYFTEDFHPIDPILTNKCNIKKRWAYLYVSNRLIEYCQNLIIEINNEKENLNNWHIRETETYDNDTYDHKIFKNLKAEKIFFTLLYQANAIDKDNNPKARKFKPICDAIFRTYKEYKNEIFKYNIKLSEYINYLEEEFSIEVKKKKLSDGSHHTSSINDLLKILISKYKITTGKNIETF